MSSFRRPRPSRPRDERRRPRVRHGRFKGSLPAGVAHVLNAYGPTSGDSVCTLPSQKPAMNTLPGCRRLPMPSNGRSGSPADRSRTATPTAPAPVSRGVRPESQAEVRRHGTPHRKYRPAARCRDWWACGWRTCSARRGPRRLLRRFARPRHITRRVGHHHGPAPLRVYSPASLRPHDSPHSPATAPVRPRIHASPIRRQTSSGSPLPQALDLVANGHSHAYDVLRGLNERRNAS